MDAFRFGIGVVLACFAVFHQPHCGFAQNATRDCKVQETLSTPEDGAGAGDSSVLLQHGAPNVQRGAATSALEEAPQVIQDLQMQALQKSAMAEREGAISMLRAIKLGRISKSEIEIVLSQFDESVLGAINTRASARSTAKDHNHRTPMAAFV
jgi:hypothetical protein